LNRLPAPYGRRHRVQGNFRRSSAQCSMPAARRIEGAARETNTAPSTLSSSTAPKKV